MFKIDCGKREKREREGTAREKKRSAGPDRTQDSSPSCHCRVHQA